MRLRAAVATALTAATWLAQAQIGLPVLAPAPAVKCLTPPPAQAGKPEYPQEAFDRKDRGSVSVELTFTSPDQPPEVKVLDAGSASADLVGSVRAFVARFRVPCLGEIGGPVTLQQTYVFEPTDGRRVMWARTRDTAEFRRGQLLRCMMHPEGALRPGYPPRARQRGLQGKVFLELRFEAPDAPPKVRVIESPQGGGDLAHAASTFAEGLRMPCLRGEPIETDLIFSFLLEGGDRLVLRDLPLVSFLRQTTNAAGSNVHFDLGTLDCPFDVRVSYRQPHRPNLVGELATKPNPARRPFLDWISRLELRLDPEQRNRVLGDSFTIQVPCGTIDL